MKEPLQFDVESLFPLLAGVQPQDFPDPRLKAPKAEPLPPPPVESVEPPAVELSPKPIQDGRDEMQVDAGGGGGADGPEPMTIDRVEEGEEGVEVPALSSAEAELYSLVENSKELIAVALLLETILAGIELDVLGTPLRSSVGLRCFWKMGSAEHGEMPSETPGAPETPMTPVAALPAMPVLTPLAPVIDASVAAAEAKEAEAPEPSPAKPDAEDQETEGKFPESLTVNEALETERDSKRQRMTPSEVAAEGMPDAELTLKMLRLCQSSLEYTARQSQALRAVQEQLGETASLAFHSESCMR
eukprot:s4380_g1.t1